MYKMLSKKFCPNCGSENVDMVAGGLMGAWMCKDCGYSGIFPEKEILGREMSGNVKNKVKRKVGGRK